MGIVAAVPRLCSVRSGPSATQAGLVVRYAGSVYSSSNTACNEGLLVTSKHGQTLALSPCSL